MIAITGAAGFIGSALAWHFNRLGRTDLVLVDDLGQDGRFRNLSGLDFADFFGKDDFLARLEGRGALPALEAIFHLGACSATTETDAAYLMRNNFGYSKTVAQWCLARSARLVYASSAATYGDGAQGYGDDAAGLSSLRPLNAYAFSKHAFDLWVRHAGAMDRVVGLKYFNVFGPNEYHKGEMRSMALRAFEQIEARGVVRLFRSDRADFADGEQRRDFVYVKDAAAITAWFLGHPRANGIFNVGSGRARTWNDLARAVFTALDRAPRIEYFDMPAELRGKYQYATEAPLERLRAAGAPMPQWSLEEAIGDYVRNYLAPGRLTLAAEHPAPVGAPQTK